ncbi:hypothetical protein EB796_023839 [Bugula neritina]|uniref:Sugar phosphate transporter domain-containing protein n=1 Tax=Bugula neritina TaxID=10212 RepID=A0A7J7IWB5_BUGNE|nr:hypothetical protein EB796_023839 [Bugula neritina]
MLSLLALVLQTRNSLMNKARFCLKFMEIPFCRTDENEIEESEENLTVVTSAITELTNTENDVTLPVTPKLKQYESVSIQHHIQESRSPTNFKALIYLVFWYMFSAGTLFSNKYILSYLDGNPSLLGCSQVCVTTVCGYFQLRICTNVRRKHKQKSTFVFNLVLLGAMRFTTVVLGLVALKYVSVSFTETIKSSAPVFTVLITWLILKERTHICVIFSLIPIMVGLGPN